jgi:hypothetical protein
VHPPDRSRKSSKNETLAPGALTLTRVTSSRGFYIHEVRKDRAGDALSPTGTFFRALPASLLKPETGSTRPPERWWVSAHFYTVPVCYWQAMHLYIQMQKTLVGSTQTPERQSRLHRTLKDHNQSRSPGGPSARCGGNPGVPFRIRTERPPPGPASWRGSIKE